MIFSIYDIEINCDSKYKTDIIEVFKKDIYNSVKYIKTNNNLKINIKGLLLKVLDDFQNDDIEDKEIPIYIETLTRVQDNEKLSKVSAKIIKHHLDDKLIKLFDMKCNINIELKDLISDSNIDIVYADGSIDNTKKIGASALCVLKDTDQVCGNYDPVTGMNKTHEEFCYLHNNATNNTAELLGIKHAIQHNTVKKYIIIASDSEYSIKSFREWIYNWEVNDYKNSTKKEIANKDIIVNTTKSLRTRNVFYTWVKGHADCFFNNRCDIIAKEALGIKT